MAEKLEDLNLPNAVVARLIKEAITDNIFVGKEARTALGRAASVFVLYVTSAASNVAKKANRKTITGQDVLDAMGDLEFESFIEPLREYQNSFKELQKRKKENITKGKQKKSADADIVVLEGEEEMEAEVETEEEEEADADADA